MKISIDNVKASELGTLKQLTKVGTLYGCTIKRLRNDKALFTYKDPILIDEEALRYKSLVKKTINNGLSEFRKYQFNTVV